MDTDINQYQEILKKQQDELESLKTQLAKSAEDQRRNELMQIFKSECTYAPVDVTKSVNQIIALEKIDKAAAETMLETFKSASAAVSESHLFGEYGTSTQGSSLDSYSDPFVSEIQKALSTVQKDDKTVKRSELVVDAIARVGGRAFQEYRNEHVRRIKRESGIL